jgi:hypothetical protein
MREKLSYERLDGITEELFNRVSYEFCPEAIIHPGIRTDYLVKKAESHFGKKPVVLDTARKFPLKKFGRIIFYDLFDFVPEAFANRVIDWYIKAVHSDKKVPVIVGNNALEAVPDETSRVLILDDVFCTGQTTTIVADALKNKGIGQVRTAVLIYTPVNGTKPDFHALQGKYSLPWRKIGI